MKKVKTNQNLSEKSDNWTLLSVLKSLIAKRTDDYVLIKLPHGQSVIITTKFKRNKETEDKIFLSVPNDYKINCRVTRYDDVHEEWVVVENKTMSAKQVSYQLYLVNKALQEGCELASILEYSELPF